MRGRFPDRWGKKSPNSGGRRPPAPSPTSSQHARLIAMYGEGRSQEAIAEELGVPRSRVRIWYRRLGFAAMPSRKFSAGANAPAAAREAGYRFAIVAPKGHAVSFHMDERTAAIGMYPIRHSGCVVRPIESLL